MSQQSIFISDGTGSNNNASVTAANQPDGGFSLQSLIARYNSAAPTLGDGYLTFLQTDVNGNLKTTATITYAANPNTVLPSQTAWIGASDGTNLQGLLVDNATNKNLRVALFSGANELSIDGSGFITVNQGTSPWVVSGTVTANAGTGTFDVNVTNPTLAVTQSGTWTVQQGTPPWTVTGTYASNVAAGSDAVKTLAGRYQSSPSAVSDGNLTYLQTDAYGVLKVTFPSGTDNDAANPGSAVPTQTSWIGGSTGVNSGNLEGLMVESSSNPNLRMGLYQGAAEASITLTGQPGSYALQTLGAIFSQTGGATTLPGPVDGYRFSGPAIADSDVTFTQTDGYGRLEVTGARAIAYAYENRSSQTITLKTTTGVLRKVIVGNAGATGALLTFYDNTVGSGQVIAKINTSNVLGQLEFDIPFTSALTYTTNSKNPGDVTITFE